MTRRWFRKLGRTKASIRTFSADLPEASKAGQRNYWVLWIIKTKLAPFPGATSSRQQEGQSSTLVDQFGFLLCKTEQLPLLEISLAVFCSKIPWIYFFSSFYEKRGRLSGQKFPRVHKSKILKWLNVYSWRMSMWIWFAVYMDVCSSVLLKWCYLGGRRRTGL